MGWEEPDGGWRRTSWTHVCVVYCWLYSVVEHMSCYASHVGGGFPWPLLFHRVTEETCLPLCLLDTGGRLISHPLICLVDQGMCICVCGCMCACICVCMCV